MAGIKLSYNYTIRNGYLYISVTESWGSGCSSGHYHITNYYYDIENDKILNSKEAYNSLGLDLYSLIKEIANITNVYEDEIDVVYKDLDFNDCDNVNKFGCGCGLKVEKNGNIVPYFINQCV